LSVAMRVDRCPRRIAEVERLASRTTHRLRRATRPAWPTQCEDEPQQEE